MASVDRSSGIFITPRALTPTSGDADVELEAWGGDGGGIELGKQGPDSCPRISDAWALSFGSLILSTGVDDAVERLLNITRSTRVLIRSRTS
jgi:hypothetical protein